MGWLREEHPELGGRYAGLYRGGSYAHRDYQERIAAQVRELAERYGVGRRRSGRGTRGAGPRGDREVPTASAPPAASAPEQLTLL
jgi:hypothetical protein